MVQEVTRTLSMRSAAFFAACACALALVASLSLGTQTAWAGGGSSLEDIYSGTVKLAVVKNPTNSYLNNIYYYSQKNSSKKPTNAKSSNTAVATVEVLTYKGVSYGSYKTPTTYPLVVHLKKAGTTTITFKHAGKSHKVKFVVKNYENPIKTLKVGSTNYASLFNQKNFAARSGTHMFSTSASKNPSGKVTVTPKSGWKLVSLKTGITKLTNGKSKANLQGLNIELKNKKTGVTEEFYVQPAVVNRYSRSSVNSSLQAASAAL